MHCRVDKSPPLALHTHIMLYKEWTTLYIFQTHLEIYSDSPLNTFFHIHLNVIFHSTIRSPNLCVLFKFIKR
jgi:hypothetical protein